MTERRKAIGIRDTHHRQLVELGRVTGHTISRLVDRAIENMLQTEAPVWRKAAKELEKMRKG